MLTVALTALAALSQAQDFTWSGDLAAGRRLTVRNISGDVRIEPASGRTASVTGIRRRGRHGDPADVAIRREDTADGPVFCVIYPRMDDREGCDTRGRHRESRRDDDRYRNDTSVEFTIRLPAGVRLHASTVSGEVDGRGLRADVEATSVSGDVRLRDVTAGFVEARTVSGSVGLEDIRADEVGAETVSGNVEFRGEVRRRGQYDLKTLSGNIVMRVPPNLDAQVTGSTFSGRFTSSFPITAQSSGRVMRRQRVSGTVGEGSARIRLESFSGNVDLREERR